MEVERRDMDYYVHLSVQDINLILDYNNPNILDPKTQLRELTAKVNGPQDEILSLSTTRDPDLLRYANDQILFERRKDGPSVKISPTVAVSLLGERPYWITRYDGENKIKLERNI